MDIHELAAGKLAALLARRKARDLFDSRLVLSHRRSGPGNDSGQPSSSTGR